MNRAEMVSTILTWEAVATRAQTMAAELRGQLAEDARAELEEQGTAPSWRIADLATVTLPVSKPAVMVADPVALTKWMIARRPAEVELTVRPASLKALLRQVGADGDLVFIPGDGEVVPGLEVRPGGQPKALTIRADPAGMAQISAEADDIMTAVAAALDEPVGVDNP